MGIALKVIESARTYKFKDMTPGRWYMNATGPRNKCIYTRIDNNLFCISMNDLDAPFFPRVIKYMSDSEYYMVNLSGEIAAERCY